LKNFKILKMSQTPAYFTKLIEEQIALLAERIPIGEKIIISHQEVKLQKNDQEERLQITSQQEIKGYLEEFRAPMREIELPIINGDEKEQSREILRQLKTKNKTFEYYYLLGKLLKDYPKTVKKEIQRSFGNNQNKTQKLTNLIRKTETLFSTIGVFYMTTTKLTPIGLRKMKDEKFDGLMEGVKSIVTRRQEASLLVLDDILEEYNFSISRELNADAGVMLPGLEFDPNLTFDDPEIPE